MATNPTNMSPNEFIEYLAKQGIMEYKQRGDEISFPCPFEGCDDDHRGNEEYHCSFNCSNCTYNCFKCGAKGNYITLRKHFGDYEEYSLELKAKRTPAEQRRIASFEKRVKEAHVNTRGSDSVRDYFNSRGINDDSIDKFMLGMWKYDGRDRFMIPVFDEDGEVAYLKLRRKPTDDLAEVVAENMGQDNPIPKYVVYPTGAKLLLVGEDQLARSASSDVLICEGELDRIIAIQEGAKMPVVTGGGGAQTFKDEWIDSLKERRNIYICLDRDKAGETGADKLAQRIAERIPDASVYKITLPFDKNSKADLTDYFVQKRGTADELFTKYAKFCCGAKPIDVTKFKEMSVEDIADVLDSTIKYDFVNKTITFLAMLLAYTESDQMNIMFNADSSTGKTYICTETSKLFPQQDVKPFGRVSPTAFFYSKKLARVDEENQPYIDMQRLILVFMEQPDRQVQENLRSILSHDCKRVPYALTNRVKSGRNAAEEGYMLGFPSTFFCSANMHIDEQEQTRCLILSPESTKEKLLASIDASIARNCDKDAYNTWLESLEARKLLMDRIQYIKKLNVGNINIGDSEYLKEAFMKDRKFVLPKTQREIQHFISLVKAMALINAPFRMKDGKIVTTNKDVDEAVKLWKPLSESMSYGVSPQVFNFYKNIILPAYRAKKKAFPEAEGVTYKEIVAEYYSQNGSYPNMDNIRHQYIPMLIAAAMINGDKKDTADSRRNLFVPMVNLTDDLEKEG